MEEELKKIQTQIGSAPNPEQLAKLRQARQQVQQNIQNNKLLAENARNRVRDEQILLLRNEVRPIAAQIAKSRHADVVLLASQEVMWFTPSADITSEIIAKMRADGDEFLQTLRGQHFDFIFADTWSGKYRFLEEALALVRPSGLYVIDDMLPQPNWPEGHAEKVAHLVSTLEHRNDFRITKMSWASGVILATKL